MNNRLGLHARPAARFVGALAGIDARVEVVNESRGRGPADGRSLTGLATLAVRQGDEIVVSGRGGGAADALAALDALAAENFGDDDEDAASAAAPPRPCRSQAAEPASPAGHGHAAARRARLGGDRDRAGPPHGARGSRGGATGPAARPPRSGRGSRRLARRCATTSRRLAPR